ncbi:MAG TPA: hypothetical protein VIL49_16550, partial [Capillimicrobium sp.]
MHSMMASPRPHVPASDSVELARWLSLIVAVATVMAAMSVALDLTADQNRPLVLGLSLLGLPLAAGLRRWGGRLPAAWFAWALLPGLMAQLAAGIYLSGEIANPANTFFLLAILYSAYFFGRATALAHLLLAGALYGAALLAIGGPLAASLDRWAFTIGVAVLIGGVVAALRDGLVERAATDPLTGVLNR